MAKLTREQFVERFKSIKLLALDVDGVLTDDSIYFGPDGFEAKRFNISDGFFMVLAMRSGLQLAIVSGRASPATVTRMKDLGVKHVLQDMKSKVAQITPLLEELGVEFSEVAFAGNELLDISLARKSGLSVAVADAAPELLEVVDYVTEKKGGCGAVREILECYFEAADIDPQSYIV
ncbi:MAG: HAD-IIIA family hydrolase [candidate division Zixibacteria bacterium]|nr:HAD-IIIA family hydrolase [candidate division Zixibacteria bacterium]MCK4607132.1 HAD-IIIA family hydrolase [candidate division Zixibacteria bacterium]